MQSKRVLQVFLPKHRVVTYLVDACPFTSAYMAESCPKTLIFLILGSYLHKNIDRIEIETEIGQTEVRQTENSNSRAPMRRHASSHAATRLDEV